jgi:hypothetical protein
MTCRRVVACASSGLMTLLLAACGGGGSGGDISPSDPPVSTATGSDAFLLFPNPQALPDASSPKIDSSAYAQAYYAAIDPTNEKDTLAKWKAVNKFDSNTGVQVTAVFGDSRDLGYGRRMTARRNPGPDGTIAFLVENYLANPGAAYGFAQSHLSLDAAIAQDRRWLILINAIEFSPAPGGGVKFSKFFSFDPVTGQRQLAVDMDGRGTKFMPGPCITCHGGRGDALIPDGTGKFAFSVVQNSASGAPGDVQAHLAPFELGIPSEVASGTSLKVGAIQFSTQAGYTRFEQEAALKTMNTFVLCSYPLPAGNAPNGPEDSCRRQANNSEWQGTAAVLIKQAYGGDGLPSATYSLSDTYTLPDGWPSNQAALYQNVVAPSCRACHILRGTGIGPQSDIDLNTFDKFQGFAVFQGTVYPRNRGFDDRIKAHVIDRGNMPLAKIVYETFWSSTSPGPPTLGAFLKAQGFTVLDAANAVLQPGRPVADPGPDRTITRTAALSAAGSLFADGYHWSIVSSPAGAAPMLDNPNSTTPTFSTTTDGTYVLALVARKGPTQSAPSLLTLVVNGVQSPEPDKIRFSHIRNALDSAGCKACHLPPAPGSAAAGPPIFFFDSQGNLRTDDAAFYAEIRGRINFTDIVASPLLRKPAGHHHGGSGPLTGFHDELAPGQSQLDADGNVVDRANYDLFLNWILNGAPR